METEIPIEEDIVDIDSYIINHRKKVNDLYEWQDKASKFFLEHKKALLEIATGSGKTFVAIQIIKKLWEVEGRKIRVLVVVPKNVIMETGWYKELVDAGIPIQDIGVFYGNIKEYSIVTLTNMQNIDKIALEIFDFVIYDECHNVGTERLLEYVEKPCKYKLGLTATVERADGNHYKLYKVFDYNIFKYTPEEALNDDILNKFDYIDIGVVMDRESYAIYDEITQQINFLLMSGGGYRKIMSSNDGMKLKMLSKMNERKNLVNNYSYKFDIVKQICLKHKDDKVIVFNQLNDQTNKVYWQLLDVGIKSKVFHSAIEKKKRDQVLIDFKNDMFNVLLTTKVLDEGYNLPKIDTGVIMAGDSTLKQTIQRMGRVLRKKEKNSTLYQIYCVGTIEQEQCEKRSELFKKLSSNHKEYTFTEGDNIVI